MPSNHHEMPLIAYTNSGRKNWTAPASKLTKAVSCLHMLSNHPTNHHAMPLTAQANRSCGNYCTTPALNRQELANFLTCDPAIDTAPHCLVSTAKTIPQTNPQAQKLPLSTNGIQMGHVRGCIGKFGLSCFVQEHFIWNHLTNEMICTPLSSFAGAVLCHQPTCASPPMPQSRNDVVLPLPADDFAPI